MTAAAPPAAVLENPGGRSPYVLLCEHASNHIPAPYGGLGLPPSELSRHIAWDIGAAALARLLARRLDATLILSGYSRLLIDCNRPPGSATSIPVRSEATEIPGNAGLGQPERAARQAAYFEPFRRMVADTLDRRGATARPTIVLGVHSFTPVFLGEARPWQAGVLYARAEGFARALIAGLSAHDGPPVGDNEPYRIEPEHDYTVPVHGDGRCVPSALLEVRQDLLGDAPGIALWADRVAPALGALWAHALVPSLGARD